MPTSRAPPLGPTPVTLPAHLDLVVVRLEGVGQLDAKPHRWSR